MKCLVTGGGGFIGSHLVEELLSRGYSVRVLDNFSTGKRENLQKVADDIELIEGDIRSYHVVQMAIRDVEVVFHHAALPSVPRSIYDPVTSNEVNVTGTINILDAARQSSVRRFVFAYSSSIYGDTPTLPKHEELIPNPMSPYAVSKLCGEKYCQVFARMYGLETVILRYFNVFGPRQDPNSQYSAVIPKFISAALSNRVFRVHGDGLQSRDFTFVKNVVHGNILAATAETPNGIVMNCACHHQITLNDLIQRVQEILGVKAQVEYVSPRPGDVRHSFASIDRARDIMNYVPVVSFEEGLKTTVDYFKFA